MIEVPEAAVLAGQINKTLTGKKIRKAITAHTPHKFAWYFGDPRKSNGLLAGRIVGRAVSFGGLVEIPAGDALICLGEGANLRYYPADEKLPDRHQFYLGFEDGTSFLGTIQMYGAIYVFPAGTRVTNKYYLLAKEKPSPLSARFDPPYFEKLFDANSDQLSLKAFLATEQRIPGLGNGVLQDILFNAKMQPKKKVSTMSDREKRDLFASIKSILKDMVGKGGRDTEKDLFGDFGGYKTRLSKNTAGTPCLVCGTVILKEAYLGGSIYYCKKCQKN